MAKYTVTTALVISMLCCLSNYAFAQQPDFSKMTTKQIMQYADSIKKAKMKELGSSLPNGNQLARFGELNDPAALNNQDTVYTTVQFNCTNTITGVGHSETVNFSGYSQHAPKYSLAGVTQVLANAMPVSFTAMPTGNNAARMKYLSHLDNSLTGNVSYKCNDKYFDHEENKLVPYQGNGNGYESMHFDFTFDPGSNLFKCVLGTQIKVNYSPSNPSKQKTGIGFGGGAAINAIDMGKPITVVGIQKFEVDEEADATVTKTSYGYKIFYNKVKHTGDRTETTHFSAVIGARIVHYDAIIEAFAMDDNATTHQPKYDNWIPLGPDKSKPDEKGNYIAFRVYLIDKTTNKRLDDVPFKVQYKLVSSQLPGICTNFPANSADTKNDLRFDADYYAQSTIAANVSELEVESKENLGKVCYARINSYDYGAYGKLTAHVVALDGSGYQIDMDAHFADQAATEIQIPKDDNNNHIADVWDPKLSPLSTDGALDLDQQVNNNKRGDGFTQFEEYRGFYVNDHFKRLDAAIKEVFVVNKSGADLTGAESYFYGKANIRIYELKEDELDFATKIVNTNRTAFKGGDQHAIDIENGVADSDDPNLVALGQMVGKNDPNFAASPGDVEKLTINLAYLNQGHQADLNYTFAHEFAHGLGVQHHGNAKPRQFFDHYFVYNIFKASNYTKIFENGTVLTDAQVDQVAKSLTPETQVVSIKYTQASGDVNCIMCYNSVYSIVQVTDKKLIIVVSEQPSGNSFCTKSDGTGINAADHKPVSVFGDALLGNCANAFTVSDWTP